MQFKTQKVENVTVMMIEGKLLAEQETSKVKDHITGELGSGQQKFIFDLKGIEFVNSACLNFLVSSKNLIATKNGSLVLCNVPDQLHKLLMVTKLDAFFTTAGRTAEAVEMLRL